MYTRLCSTDELNCLIIFVDYSETIKALDLIKKLSIFAKIISTPKAVFSASSLAIAINSNDLEKAVSEVEGKEIKPIKISKLDKCALSYHFQY